MLPKLLVALSNECFFYHRIVINTGYLISFFFDKIYFMKKIVEPLLEWYKKNKRDLPWREDHNPYHVWISEIMLQQTRIEAVIDYYKRFMKRIPDIKTLSLISEDELLKLWEGLGYYSRARNLKKAATMIMAEYDGVFPHTYEQIKQLPGIGEYTAGAISSISFSLKEVAIDGNVLRVYSRVKYLDIDVSDSKIKKEVGTSLKKILPADSGDFNQGIMELGETICLPNGSPKCDICPIGNYCKAHLKHDEMKYPRKTVKVKKTEEDYTVFLFICNGNVAIRKRQDGLLKNMWEFPNEAGFLEINQIPYSNVTPGISNTHIFTHKKWNMISYIIYLDQEIDGYEWVSISEIESNYAIPTAFQPFLKQLKKNI